MTSLINKHDCKFSQRALFAIVAVLFSAANVFAAIITQPTSLSPGDTFRLAFVTSGTRDAASSDIADYNTFVTNAANAVPELASLGTTWTAIGSTEDDDARDNTNTVPSTVTGGSLGVPIFLLNDTKLADSNDDLWDGDIDVPLNRTELDTQFQLSTLVWTGTAADGTQKFDLLVPRGLGSTPFVSFGAALFSDARWVDNSSADPGFPVRLYALSDELQVIPEPGTFTLLLTALGAVGVMCRGRKQKAAHHC